MSDYVERMICEQKELQERLSTLCAFIGTEKYFSLSPANRIMLEKQREVMKEYRDILDVRIELSECAK